ncbi:hypothetical protein [Natrinema sp. SYSU A 869]|uniref:hypothetical protein n=1 Tax=Natrinema sp. SYSU A 869 TaxID=2871694 RepID=UPI001CA3D6BD|nr:hypothetical protein [Natrinema sp. SYSU A 869]
MSVDAERDDRDLEAELASPVAGQFGIPVDAVCVGCGRTRVKRATLEAMDQDPGAEPRRSSSSTGSTERDRWNPILESDPWILETTYAETSMLTLLHRRRVMMCIELRTVQSVPP